MRILFFLSLFVVSLPSRPAGAQGIDDAMAVRSVHAVEISPDGSQVAYDVAQTTAYAYSAPASTVWIGFADGRPSRKLGDGTGPAWSPDAKRIAFLSAGQIWTVGSREGAPQQLTRHPSPVLRFKWSPDGRRIAFVAQDPSTRKTGGPIVIDVSDRALFRLWTLDLSSGQTALLTPGDYSAGGDNQWFPDTISWSPDSSAVAFTKRPHSKPGSHLREDLATVAVPSGELQIKVKRPGLNGYPQWAPDGGRLAFISTGKFDWVSISHLYFLSLKDGAIRDLTPSFDRTFKEFSWTADGLKIYFVAGEGVAEQIFGLDAETGKIRRLTEGQSVYSQLSISRDGAHCAFVRQNPAEPPDVFLSPLPEIKPKRVSDINSHIDRSKLPETEVLRWKSKDGLEIEGIVHKPIGYQAGKRYPLIVYPHGGPHSVAINSFPTAEWNLFPARGWVVFRPNFRGSGNYGEKFLRADRKDWGGGDYQDVMTGVDELIRRGWVDGDRMAIVGASYGGYMSAWTISQTNRFKAAVVGCGITDVPAFVRSTDVPDRFEGYLGTDPAEYPRHSPIFFGENIRTPALIWHGDQDQRVPPTQSRELYTQLVKNRVPTEFVLYPGEQHGLHQPAHLKDLLEREVAWLEKWVIQANSR